MKDRILNWYFHDLADVKFYDMTRGEATFVIWRGAEAVACLCGFLSWVTR
jgi:hypothetical protein